MPPSVREMITQTPMSLLRLVSMVACLMLWLCCESSAATGLSPAYSLRLSDVLPRRFTLSQQAWGSNLLPLLTPVDVLYEAAIFRPTWSNREGSAAAWPPLQLLSVVTYTYSPTLQLSLSQFLLPLEPLDLTSRLSLPLELASERRVRRQFTMAQLYGTVPLDYTSHQTLDYALYAGGFTDEFPDHLLVGARVRYRFERGEVTVGFDSLYSHYPEGVDSFTPLARTARLSNVENQIIELLLRLEQDRRVLQDTHVPGLAAGDPSPVGVFIKPVLNLSQQWAVFYRFDHLSLGQGWPKWTEHALGVRFFPLFDVVLRAELLISHLNQTPTDATGFRLSGSIRF